MKRIVLLCLSVCLLALPVEVQAAWRFSPKKIAAAVRRAVTPKRAKRPEQPVRTPQSAIRTPQTARPVRLGKPDLETAQSYQHTLDKRAIRSIQQAKQARRHSVTNPILLKGPVDRPIIGPGPFSAEHMYPEKLYLQHPQQGANLTEAYFVAQSNRLYAKNIWDMDTYFWPAFKAARPRFYQEARAFEQPANVLEWTAQQISATTQNLFIGEIHGHPEIPQFVDELISLLHAQNPDRKIFLFTEFLKDLEGKEAPLKEKLIWMQDTHHKVDLWETAEQLDIPLIGLESQKWPYDYKLLKVDPEVGAYTGTVRTGETPEGLRIRNDHWYEILQEYRQQNPDALFIIYTGSGHSLYFYPFSLAKRFSKETTLMLDLTMEEFRYNDGTATRRTDHLEILDDDLSFPQPVLKWSSPDLVELSGFDIRIKLPVKENPFEYERKK